MKARLVEFIDQLRAAGVRASLAESLDAMAAVGIAGVEREALRAALAAALVKDEADRPKFDALFDRFFSVSGRKRGAGERSRPVGEGIGRGHGQPASAGQRAEETKPRPGTVHRQAEQERHRAPQRDQAAGQRLARRRELLSTPFETMDPRSVAEVEELVEELSRRWRAHLRRRLQPHRYGRLDFRKTIRASLGSGGVPVNPVFRTQRPGKVDLIALCDLSYSTATAADFCLALLAPAASFFRRARFFGYVDRAVEISVERGHVVPHQPLDLAARSDFGRVLRQLWEHGEPTFTRNTLVLILGDARNNRRPPRADILARIQGRVRQLVWLNPESRTRWNTGDSVVDSYARHCDMVLAATNLRQLAAALRSSL